MVPVISWYHTEWITLAEDWLLRCLGSLEEAEMDHLEGSSDWTCLCLLPLYKGPIAVECEDLLGTSSFHYLLTWPCRSWLDIARVQSYDLIHLLCDHLVLSVTCCLAIQHARGEVLQLNTSILFSDAFAAASSMSFCTPHCIRVHRLAWS